MDKICLIVCESLKKEFDYVINANRFEDVILETYPSTCSKPKDEALSNMEQIILKHGDTCSRFELLISSCCINDSMKDLKPFNVHYVEQCHQLILNKSIFNDYVKDGAYIITPWWVDQWKDYMSKWDFDRSRAEAFFKSFAKYVMLLDSGLHPEALNQLNAFAEYVGLPARVLHVGMDYFAMFIKNIIYQCRLESMHSYNDNILGRTSSESPFTKYPPTMTYIQRRTDHITQNSHYGFKSLVELLPDAVYIHQNEKVVYSNTSGLKLLGLSEASQILGKHVMNFVHKDFHNIIRSRMHDVQFNKKQLDLIEEKFIRNDGTEIDVEVASAPYFYNNSPATLVVARDITERKTAQRTAKEQDMRLKQITENMMDIIGSADAHKMQFYFSPSSKRLLGYSPEVLQERSGSHFIHPDDLNNVQKSFKRVMITNLPDTVEYRFKHFEGHYIWLESVFTPYADNNGNVLGITFSSRDITKRKLIEERLHKSEEGYRELIEFLPEAVFVHDDRKVLFCNKAAAKLYGEKNPKRLVGMPMTELIHEDVYKFHYGKFNNIIHSKSSYLFKNGRMVAKNKSVLNVEANATFIQYQGSSAILAVVRDITEKKHIEELKKNIEERNRLLNEAMEYEKLRTEFFSNISHEFRTPLNVILGTLQLIDLYQRNGTLTNNMDKLNRYSGIMKQNCLRLLRLVNNLIDITRIGSDFYEINLKNHNIVEILENITLSVAEYIEGKGLSIIFDTDTEEKLLACDPDKIERIILNLLSNAVKFSKPGGSITVDIKDKGDNIIISVSDTGIGIPEDKLGIIFERFRQIDKSLTREHEGSGIGLSLVKSLVEMHGGSIEVKSQYGHGSEFIITLPSRILPEEIIPRKVETIHTMESYVERINVEFSDIYS